MKSLLAPLLKKGGMPYSPGVLVAAIGVLTLLQAFINAPFDKGGQWDLIKRPIGTYF